MRGDCPQASHPLLRGLVLSRLVTINLVEEAA